MHLSNLSCRSVCVSYRDVLGFFLIILFSVFSSRLLTQYYILLFIGD